MMGHNQDRRHSRDSLFAVIAAVAIVALLTSAAPVRAYAQTTAYEIFEITYTIEGRTREYALRSELDLQVGLEFGSLGELIDFLADQRQLLSNIRPLEDAWIEYSVVGADSDRLLLRVDVFTVDSWNIIALPFLRYTSDDGLLLSIRARDYNFFGSLERVAGDVDWAAAWPDGGLLEADRVDLVLRGALPFEWRGYEWRWDAGLSVAFIEDANNQYSIQNGLSITYPWLFDLDWTVGYLQDIEFRGDGDLDRFWFVSTARLSTTVPTPWRLPGGGKIEYEPSTEIRQPYGPGGLIDSRRGMVAAFDQTLAAGRINWFENFRDGTRASVSNRNAVNLYRAAGGNDMDATRSVLETEVSRFGAYLRDSRVPVGLSARLGGFVQLTSLSGGTADISTRVRGIRTAAGDSLSGEFGFFSNADLYASAFRIERVVEGHIGLFVDIGAADTFEAGIAADDLAFGSGIEVILFPLFSRALYLRASLGFDLRAAVEDTTGNSRRREIFIGIDHHY